MRAAVLVLFLLTLSGCGGENRNWKETIPVVGQVNVDGKPTEGVMITFHPEGGMDQKQPTETTGTTDKEGRFAASTYSIKDGAPAGDYKLTFTLPKLNVISMSMDGDEFKGRYADPKQSSVSVTVVSGKPVNLGTLELKRK